MNFIDYCIATKNYSALSAVNEYSKSFSEDNYKRLLGKDYDRINEVTNDPYKSLLGDKYDKIKKYIDDPTQASKDLIGEDRYNLAMNTLNNLYKKKK